MVEITAKAVFSPSLPPCSKFYALKYIFVIILFIPLNPVLFSAPQNTWVEYRFREVGEMPRYLIKTWTRRLLWMHLRTMTRHGLPDAPAAPTAAPLPEARWNHYLWMQALRLIKPLVKDKLLNPPGSSSTGPNMFLSVGNSYPMENSFPALSAEPANTEGFRSIKSSIPSTLIIPIYSPWPKPPWNNSICFRMCLNYGYGISITNKNSNGV